MEKYIKDLKSIILIPSKTNSGVKKDMNFMIQDSADRSLSYPIFAEPEESVVSSYNAKTLYSAGLKPILPVTEPLETRLNYCQGVFCEFTIDEIKRNFLEQNLGRGALYHVYIKADTGHSEEIFSVAQNLKRYYGAQVTIMSGTVMCPEVYSDYSRGGLDYMVVGEDMEDYTDKYGFSYPLPSLLENIRSFIKTGGIGLPKQVKIIAKGDIQTPADVMKCLAVGADYVMLGKTIAGLVEGGGQPCKRQKKDGNWSIDPINPSLVKPREGIQRNYKGDWIPINGDLGTWLKGFVDVASQGFLMTGSLTFDEFKKRVRYGYVEDGI